MDAQWLYCPLMNGRPCMGRGCAMAKFDSVNECWLCGFVTDGMLVKPQAIGANWTENNGERGVYL